MTHSIYTLGQGLRTILFHRFFFEGETRAAGRERLKRQCDWLARTFRPRSLEQARVGLTGRRLPADSLLVTIDDAKVEILEVLDIFRSFSIPIAIFACVGWCAQEESGRTDHDISLAGLVADINWYRGPVRKLLIGGLELELGRGERETAVELDRLLRHLETMEPGSFELPSLRAAPPRVSCTFAELADIAGEQVAVGGHSVSHINLAKASPIRQDYEIRTTKRILAKTMGHVDAFAYPYGMGSTHDQATRGVLERAGFDLAFLTHSDLATSETDPLALPRISMPDRAMPDYEFRARCAGAGILYRKVRSVLSSQRA